MKNIIKSENEEMNKKMKKMKQKTKKDKNKREKKKGGKYVPLLLPGRME